MAEPWYSNSGRIQQRYLWTDASAARLREAGCCALVLKDQTREIQAMIVADDLGTADPLGLGGLLIDAYRVEQLLRQGEGVGVEPHLIETLLTTVLAGLPYYIESSDLQIPAEHWLAFRELGLAIGLHAVRLMEKSVKRDPVQTSHHFLSNRIKLIGQKFIFFVHQISAPLSLLPSGEDGMRDIKNRNLICEHYIQAGILKLY